jgi:hypothetical protein
MCLSTLKTCTINLEVERCARGIFTSLSRHSFIPSIPRTCRIGKLSTQVPVEILNDAYSRYGVFQYLPALTTLAPYLHYLALHLARKECSGAFPGHEYIGSSYDTLLHGIRSASIQTLIIDTCDVEPSSVRQCAEDFLDTISPITSLSGFSNLCCIVAL